MTPYCFITILKSQNRATEDRIYFESTAEPPSERELSEAIKTLCVAIGAGIRWDPNGLETDSHWRPTDAAFRFESGGRQYWYQPAPVAPSAHPPMTSSKHA